MGKRSRSRSQRKSRQDWKENYHSGNGNYWDWKNYNSDGQHNSPSPANDRNSPVYALDGQNRAFSGDDMTPAHAMPGAHVEEALQACAELAAEGFHPINFETENVRVLGETTETECLRKFPLDADAIRSCVGFCVDSLRDKIGALQ